MTIEINGPANIITFIRVYKLQNPAWALDSELATMIERIEKEAFDTIKYIERLSNPSGIAWHQIKAEGSNAV